MPELPEVETIARQLDRSMRGQRVLNLRIFDAKLNEPSLLSLAPQLKNCIIERVYRAGKQAVFHLRGTLRQPDLWLAVHLRMTGRLLWLEQGEPADQRQPRAILHCEGGALFFCDTRRFGVITLCQSPDAFDGCGLDPMAEPLPAKRLAALINGSSQEIKVWLMRQDRLAGIGNIYASEILFLSGIHPARRAAGLSALELKRLAKAIREVLRDAIHHCGVTFSDFQDAHGKTGSYQSYLHVYGKAGQICPRCGNIIERCVQQQRSTFFCPSCQA